MCNQKVLLQKQQTSWRLLSLMSLASYFWLTSVSAEVRYTSTLNPVALNAAELFCCLFASKGQHFKEKNALFLVKRDTKTAGVGH